MLYVSDDDVCFRHVITGINKLNTKSITETGVKLYINQFVYVLLSSSSAVYVRGKGLTVSKSLSTNDEIKICKSSLISNKDLPLDMNAMYNKGMFAGVYYKYSCSCNKMSIKLKIANTGMNKFIFKLLQKEDGIKEVHRHNIYIIATFKTLPLLSLFKAKMFIKDGVLPVTAFKMSESFMFGFIRGLTQSMYIVDKLALSSNGVESFILFSKILLFYGVSTNIYKMKYKTNLREYYRFVISIRQLEKLASLMGYYYFNSILPYSNTAISNIKLDNNYIKIHHIEVIDKTSSFYLVAKNMKHYLKIGVTNDKRYKN